MGKEEKCVKKYLKFIIIIALVIILSTAAYIAVDKSKTSEETQKSQEGVVDLCGFDTDDIKNMTVTTPDGTYEFKFEDSLWSWADEDNAPFNCSTVSLTLIANAMSDLTSTKIVAENADNLSKYGFDNPVTISCKTSDGKEYSIELGSKNPTGDSYSVKKSGENTVYAVSSSTGDSLNVQKDALKNNYLIDVFISELRKIKLERHGELIFDVEKNDSGVWEIIAPIKEMTPDYTKISSYSDLIVRANAAAFIEENPSDLSKYGLDNPSYVLNASTDEEDVEVIFGNDSEDIAGGIYTLIKSAKLQEVMVFYKSNISFLEADTMSIVDPKIYGCNLRKISDIDLVLDGQNVKLSMDSANNEYSFNGTVIDDTERINLYTEFVQSFNMMQIAGTETDYSNENQTPALEINYTLKDGSAFTTAYYYDEDSDRYYLFKNDTYTGTYVSSDSIKNIKAAYAGILNRASE